MLAKRAGCNVSQMATSCESKQFLVIFSDGELSNSKIPFHTVQVSVDMSETSACMCTHTHKHKHTCG